MALSSAATAASTAARSACCAAHAAWFWASCACRRSARRRSSPPKRCSDEERLRGSSSPILSNPQSGHSTASGGNEKHWGLSVSNYVLVCSDQPPLTGAVAGDSNPLP